MDYTTTETETSRQNKKLIDAGARIKDIEAKEDGEIGYTSIALSASASMPHSDQKGVHFYERHNDEYRLIIADTDRVGLPFGVLPRLILAFIVSEAVMKNSPDIDLGERFSNFFKELKMIPSGGKWGSIKRFRDQANRLFSTTISIRRDSQEHMNSDRMLITTGFDLWWGATGKRNRSSITLSQEFFKEIMEHHAPIDMRALRSLTKSPMAIDVYLWLTYRNFSLRQITHISWANLQKQFGAGYPNTKVGRNNFQKKFKLAVLKVKEVYPNLEVDYLRGRVVLIPSPTSIPKLSTDPHE